MLHKTRYEGVSYRINKRGLKVFEARFKVDNKEYRRKIGEEPHYNAKSASQKRYDMIDEIKQGINATSQTITDIFDRYIELRSPLLSESWSYNMRKTYNKHIKPVIGNFTPKMVDGNEIQIIMNSMIEKGYAVSTVKQIKDCISGLYSHMIPKEENIGSYLKVPKFDNKRYFTIEEEEAKRLYDIIVNYPAEKWRLYFSFILHGRRKSEVMKLEWRYINLNSNTYEIIPENSKTNKHISAPILPFLKEMLEQYTEPKEGYVFKGKNGSHVSSTGIDFQWRNIKSRAGLPDMRLHDVRHLIGHIAISSGMSLEQIGNVLGHGSTLTTKRYSTIKRDSAREVLSSVMEKLATKL